MAFALVNPVSALWQRRGLTSLLMPDGYDAFAAPQQSAHALSGNGPRVKPADAHVGQSQANQTHTGQPRERQSWQQSRAQTPQGQQQQSQTTQAQAHAQIHAGHTAAQATDQPAGQGKPAAWLPLPPHVWPAPWQTRLEQTRPGPVLWTYWNLGPDMCDPQTPGRLNAASFCSVCCKTWGILRARTPSGPRVCRQTRQHCPPLHHSRKVPMRQTPMFSGLGPCSSRPEE